MKENATSDDERRELASASATRRRRRWSWRRSTSATRRSRRPSPGASAARLVDPGNLVGAGGPDQRSPPSTSSTRSTSTSTSTSATRCICGTRCASSASRSGSNVGKAPVQVGLQNEKGYPHDGVLDFADNSISTSTGTIALRARLRERGHDALSRASSRACAFRWADPGRCWSSPQRDRQRPAGRLRASRERLDDVVERRSIVKGPLTADGCAIRSGLTADGPRDRQRAPERAAGREGRAGARTQPAGPPPRPTGRRSRPPPCSPSSSSSGRSSRTSSRSS